MDLTNPIKLDVFRCTIRLTNDTDDTITIKKDQHLCQIRPIVPTSGGTTTCSLSQLDKKQMTTIRSLSYAQNTDRISIDPDNMLSPSEKNLFRSLHTKYSEVFNPSIPLDNGQSGNIKAKVNIGPTYLHTAQGVKVLVLLVTNFIP